MARLTAAKRNALPSSAFADPVHRAYPINDPSHAKNALARSSQHASSSKLKTIKKKVAKRFPSIRQGKPMAVDKVAKDYVS